MTRRSELGSVLGNLRRERTGEGQETAPAPSTGTRRTPQEKREAFTSRLLPSQRRYLKRLASDLEEEVDQRVTVEDVLDVVVRELQENAALRERLAARLAGGE